MTILDRYIDLEDGELRCRDCNGRVIDVDDQARHDAYHVELAANHDPAQVALFPA